MLGNVLNSKVAVEASVRVVRAFILMREQLAAHKELAGKLAELEQRVSGHDEAIQELFEAIRQLIEPPCRRSSTKKSVFIFARRRRLYRLPRRKRF